MEASPMNVADPLSLTRLLDEAVRLGRANFRTIFPPIAIPLATLATLMSAGQMVFTTMKDERLAIPAVIGFVLVALVWLVVFAFAYAALLRVCVDVAAGRRPVMAEAWKTLLDWKLVGTWVVAGLGLVAGWICCCLPGVILALLWAVCTQVVLEERLGPIEALTRSSHLMRHNPSRNIGDHPMLYVFLISVAAAIISQAASMLVSLPMLIAMGIAAIHGIVSGAKAEQMETLMQGAMWLQVPTQFFASLVQTAVQMFSLTAISILYFELRRRMEGDDLERAVAGVGVAPEPS
jgi:hypothetical protein